MKTLLTLVTLAGMASSAAAQVCCIPTTACESYRVVYKTVYEQKQVTAYRIRYDTVYETRKVVTHKPVWETSFQERRYTVRKPVYETSSRDEQCVTYVPQTVYRPVTVDRGCWENQVACVPGTVTNRLTWKPAACVVDPLTGTSRYDRAGFAWVPVKGPDRQVVRRVWKPNLVTQQVPETRMVRKVTVRKVPIQTVRYVDEQKVERIPVQTCKMVAEEREVKVPVCVEKRVPVTYTCSTPRLVAFREPLCGGCPTCVSGGAVITETPAAQQTEPLSLPMPTDAGSPEKTYKDDGTQSVKKEPVEEPKKPAAPAPEKTEEEKPAPAPEKTEDKKPMLPESGPGVDPGEEDKDKGGEVKKGGGYDIPF